MLTNISGQNRTRRSELSPKVLEQRVAYAELAQNALFRGYPSMRNFTAELCMLDAGEVLELFWSILDLGGPAPGGWHQVHDLRVVLERAGDGAVVTLPLSGHIAGFHAWYRMRGGMISILPNSFYFNLAAGDWSVYLEGTLQDAQPLCLFADAFHDLFHYPAIKDYYDRAKAPMLEKLCVTEEDLCAAAAVPHLGRHAAPGHGAHRRHRLPAGQPPAPGRGVLCGCRGTAGPGRAGAAGHPAGSAQLLPHATALPA